ncbi:hypothetical protein SAMN05660748_3202 [Blastococcus aggregatus]|uniref:Uncharacterized protein n=1 Tax=Blastococcus aggregatus TaxID=38502 RepID=A0A285V8M0_9ACTN|nr:hypothetical protein [Blastococcus aggregatus]SOC50454.1 hypothetical protein SAMN05660748_3202 [Blastococcus aggregatus]
MRGSRPARGLGVLAALGLALHVSGATEAAFAVSTGTPVMSLSSASDWKPPIVSGAVVVKSEGGTPGFIRQGGSYQVYATVGDDPSSRPASGVGRVVVGITGLPPMDLVAVAPGVTYSHRTSPRTEAYAPAGSYTAWVRATDLATPGNTSAEYPLGVVVDNTAPAPTSVTVANGGTARRADAGDTVTFGWGEVLDPHSVVPGWTGAAMDVTVRITDSTATGGDVLTVWNAANTAQLPLGQIVLGGNYVTATTTFGASGAATRSRLSWAATPGTAFTVVLGPPDVAGNVVTSSTAGTVTWTPSTTVFDRAGNRSPATAVTESGTADRDF